MLCPHCGSQIPDEAQVCPRCRTSFVAASPVLATTDVAKDLPQQEKRIRQLLIGFVLAAVLGWMAWHAGYRYRSRLQSASPKLHQSQETIPVVGAPLTLRPHMPLSFGFVVPPGCTSAVLEAHFDESADQGPPVQITVFDEAAYAAWRSRQASRATFTGRIRAGMLQVVLPPFQARYFLVFTSASASVPKTLSGAVQLDCTRGAP